jgi:hypothetical protein
MEVVNLQLTDLLIICIMINFSDRTSSDAGEHPINVFDKLKICKLNT